MNRLGKTLLSLIGFCLIPLLTSCSALENSDRVQIVQLGDFYPIRSHAEENAPDVHNAVSTSVKNRCGCSYIAISPASLGMSEEAFNQLWRDLRKNTGQGRFYRLTYGECAKDSLLVTKIVDCSDGACGKEYRIDTSKMWLNTWSWAGDNIPMTRNGQYTSAGSKSSAQYFINLPLKEVPEQGAWKVEIRYTENPDVIAMDAYVDNADFLLGKFILDYKAHYLSGNLYEEGGFDRQGKSQGGAQGKITSYYDSPGKVRSVSHFKDGKLHGEFVSYNKNGTVAKKEQYLLGKDVTKNGIVYGSEGQILERYNYNSNGRKEGTWLNYYPDGTLKLSESYANGTLVGTSEEYWPNGKIKLKNTYKNGSSRAQVKWYESGQKESESFYNDKHQSVGTHKSWYENGNLYSDYRYYANGRQASTALWNSDGHPSSRETYSIKGERRSSERWFVNGKLRSRTVYQNGQLAVEEEYFDNGQLKERARWSNGNRKDREEWRKDGTRYERVKYNKKGEFTLIEKYDQKGKLEKRHKYER
ncbi:MORN repeat variant [Leminorella richardii]|uniref:MORN repeat variant n=1 Tax=Leminorella richardii TaxID=158841 RepID=A0A2X4UAY9_9GAMM|nr:toxin-antitoxin system YwqK family antitoxin [Leminorella richardii]SQI36071.1 MORN repeat variant [Leminorella richardii]